MDNIDLTVYHGTDLKYLCSIKDNGFTVKQNDEHWLGNGIYFFIDYELAKWWAENEHKNFGNNIRIPIVIKSKIKYDVDYTVDLRILDDYNWVNKQYDEFHKSLLKLGVNKISDKKLRCTFFDWLKDEYDIKIIIAGFYKKNSSYVAKNNFSSKFCIPYIECQVCVYDKDIISICDVKELFYYEKKEKWK